MTMPISGENMIRLREIEEELDQLHAAIHQASPEFEHMGQVDAATEFERLHNLLSQTYDQAARLLKFVTEIHRNQFPERGRR